MFNSAQGLLKKKSTLIGAGALSVVALVVPLTAALVLAPQDATAQQRGPAGGQPGLAVRTTPAQLGTISNVLSYAGSVQASQQVNVAPQTSGTISTLAVDVGSQVHQGDVIATLQQQALPAALLQAQANVQAAQSKLDQINEGARPETIQEAQAVLQAAQAKLLGDLQGRPETVASAQAALNAAQQKLQELENEGRPESVQEAQDNLNAAQSKLQALLNGQTPDVLSADKTAVDADISALGSAEAGLANLPANDASNLQAAQSQLQTDQAATAAAQAAVTNAQQQNQVNSIVAQTTADSDQAAVNAAQAALQAAQNPLPSQIAAAQATVATAQSTLQSAQSSLNNLSAGGSTSTTGSTSSGSGSGSSGSSTSAPCAGSNSNSTVCSDDLASGNAAVTAGYAQVNSAQQALTLLQHGGPPATLATLQSAVTAAQDRLKQDQAKLGAQGSANASSLATAQSNMTADQQKVVADQAKVTALTNGSIASERATAQSALQAAQDKLTSDQAKLDVATGGPLQTDLQQAQAAVDSALQAFVLAQNPNQPQDIQQQLDAVQQAQETLATAQVPATQQAIQQDQATMAQDQAALQLAQVPYLPSDIQAQQALVAQAESAVATAQNNLDQTVVTAPFTGVISAKLLSAGALASASAPIVTEISSAVEVHITIEEARVSQIQPGLEVQVQVPAYPGQNIPGKVVTVAPSGNATAHTFDVKIIPDQPSTQLLVGEYVNVQITAQQDTNVVLIPTDAIVQTASGPVVFVDNNGVANQVPVQIGLQDSTNTEITGGVNPGDQVVIAGQTALQNGARVQIVAPTGSSGQSGGSGQSGQSGTGGQGGSGAAAGGGAAAGAGASAGGAGGGPNAQASPTPGS